MSSPPDSPAQTGLSFLVITTPEGTRKVPLLAERLLLGRHPTCDIVVEESVVSGRHAELERQPDGSYKIIDLNSSNGLIYEGQRVQQHDLHTGDVLSIGNRVTLGYQVVVPDQPATRQNSQNDSGKTVLLGDT
ncbi:MAG: FHA domain-containing protein, partial [Gloeomargarita sp. DG_1_5_bins_55]